MTRPAPTAAIAAAAYIATVWLANYTIVKYGMVPVLFGFTAPAGVYFAGVAFTLRDVVQEQWGRWPVVACILIGAALSAALSTRFAVASGTAFLVSELADMAVYTPLREQGRWLLAVTASNTVGLTVDSVLFLTFAFGSLTALPGQIIGKATMTVAALIVWRLLQPVRDRASA